MVENDNEWVKRANIEESQVFAKIGKDMFERRGGWEHFKKTKRKKVSIKDRVYK